MSCNLNAPPASNAPSNKPSNAPSNNQCQMLCNRVSTCADILKSGPKTMNGNFDNAKCMAECQRNTSDPKNSKSQQFFQCINQIPNTKSPNATFDQCMGPIVGCLQSSGMNAQH